MNKYWDIEKHKKRKFDAFIPELKEPPCKDCDFWIPHVEYNKNRKCTGICCCVAEEMVNDFSCFEIKKEKLND